MKVTHVFWGLGYGGIETMLINIANAQVQYGADVHVILVNELCEQTLLNRFDTKVNVHSLNRKLGSKSLNFIWGLNRLLRSINPERIHLHGPEFYSMIMSKDLRRKTVLTLHDTPNDMSVHWAGWKMLVAILTFGFMYNMHLIRMIPKVFAISDAVRVAFKENYGVDSTVICNGIITSDFLHRSQICAKRPYRIVQISRLYHEKKGQDLLIRAAAILKNVDVTFIGDGESMDYLKKLCLDLGQENNVHFLGKQPQEYIFTHLKDYDLFVQPSRWEGFGLTVAEAMAANVPVLVSSGQGPAEITENDKYGWLFETGNVENLASQISYIFSHYDEALAKSVNGQKHVCRNYDVAVTAKRYLELY